jgi:hypothetical protein
MNPLDAMRADPAVGIRTSRASEKGKAGASSARGPYSAAGRKGKE